MKELINLERIWDWCSEAWVTSFGTIVLMVLAFFVGVQYQEKQITDDCKFMGSFRDGTQTYNCNQRAK